MLVFQAHSGGLAAGAAHTSVRVETRRGDCHEGQGLLIVSFSSILAVTVHVVDFRIEATIETSEKEEY